MLRTRPLPSPARPLLPLVAALLILAAPASAQVTVEGTGEPAFTNTTTNTQFVRYQKPSAAEAYRVGFSFYRDNVATKEERVDTPASSGTLWANWSGVATLEEGKTYGICAQGSYRFPNDALFYTDGPSSCAAGTQTGQRSATTIDRSKPTISVVAGVGAATTREAKIALRIDYNDAYAFPFPGNFACAKPGADPAVACAGPGALAYAEACSVPNNGQSKVNSFDCQVELPASTPDGPLSFCAVAADAAVPDNPSSSNQTGRLDQANLSTMKCDTIVLDRTAPSTAIRAGATTVTAGDPVSFSSQASDATSGLSSEGARWSFGDGTAGATGDAPTHTFSQPGTYTVELRVKDGAGNEGVATQTITVTAKVAAPGPDNPGAPGAGSGGPTPADVVKAAGGGAAQERTLGGLRVLAPKRVRLTRTRRSVLIGVSSDQPGKLSLSLARGRKVHARSSAVIGAGSLGQYLRLPRKLAPGKLSLKVSFAPKGARWALGGKLPITFTASGKARASTARAATAGSAPRASISSKDLPAGRLPDGRLPQAPIDRTLKLR